MGTNTDAVCTHHGAGGLNRPWGDDSLNFLSEKTGCKLRWAESADFRDSMGPDRVEPLGFTQRTEYGAGLKVSGPPLPHAWEQGQK